MTKKSIIKTRSTWRKEISEAVGVFLGFHDYYQNTEDKKENDGCLDLLVEKIIHIASHKKKYYRIRKWKKLEL